MYATLSKEKSFQRLKIVHMESLLFYLILQVESKDKYIDA